MADPVNPAVVHAWHPGRWFTRMHEVAAFGEGGGGGGDNGTFEFGFGRGGFQGAEGSDTAGAFYIENALAELDAPGEWFWRGLGPLLPFLLYLSRFVPETTHVVPTRYIERLLKVDLHRISN